MSAESGALKYQGVIAEGYNEKRIKQAKWWGEHRSVAKFLVDLPEGTSVVDCPVGTGRFIPLYEFLGFPVLGLDISDDMLSEAAKAAKSTKTYFQNGDARSIDLGDKSCDVAVCIRLFRWLELDEVTKVLGELQRVARKRVIFNARVSNHPYARPMPLIVSALKDWVITGVEEVERDYLTFKLEPANVLD